MVDAATRWDGRTRRRQHQHKEKVREGRIEAAAEDQAMAPLQPTGRGARWERGRCSQCEPTGRLYAFFRARHHLLYTILEVPFVSRAVVWAPSKDTPDGPKPPDAGRLVRRMYSLHGSGPNVRLTPANGRLRVRRSKVASGSSYAFPHICCDRRSREVCVGPGSATNDRSASTSGSLILDVHPYLDGAFPYEFSLLSCSRWSARFAVTAYDVHIIRKAFWAEESEVPIHLAE